MRRSRSSFEACLACTSLLPRRRPPMERSFACRLIRTAHGYCCDAGVRAVLSCARIRAWVWVSFTVRVHKSAHVSMSSHGNAGRRRF